MNRREKGFVHIGLIVLGLVVFGVIGFAGWRILKKDSPKTTNLTTVDKLASEESNAKEKNSQKADTTTASTIPKGYIEYSNKDIGFKFSYPSDWGTIKRTGNDSAELRTDGLNGNALRTTFEGGNVKVFPRGNELNGDTAVGIDEGLYGGGYIQRGDSYYSIAKYTGEEVQITEDNILAKVTSSLGTVLIVKTGTLAGTEIQILLNLPKGKSLSGLDMRFKTGDYDFAEEGKIDASGLETLKQVAQTFSKV